MANGATPAITRLYCLCKIATYIMRPFAVNLRVSLNCWVFAKEDKIYMLVILRPSGTLAYKVMNANK